MSFVSLNASDFVVSADSITSTLWTGGVPTLNNFFTSSATSSFNFFLDVFQTSSVRSDAEVQFSIAYGEVEGSGSAPFNNLVTGSSPSKVSYGQYRTLVNGDENTNFSFGTGNTDSRDIYVLNINRARYKEKIFPGTFNLVLSGSDGTNPARVQLTDNSKDVTALTFTDAGRVFDIVSGTNGSAVSTAVTGGITAGFTPSGSYGKFLPDVGLIILNPRALALSQSLGGVGLTINDDLTDTAMVANNSNLFESIKLAQTFSLNSEETITSDFVFVRVRNTDFNYSTNPSMISGSGEFVHSSLINNPQTFITTVGLYNDANELLSVAKLSKPLVKDFTKEALVRVKLDF
tara:strand:+ start:6567 stop:7607 length:1041 start_codon:yes stop_codon:yes gene_type:complete